MKFTTCLAICCLAICLTLLSLPVSAQQNGRALADIAEAAKQQNALPPMPWISALRITDRDSSDIELADGRQLMQRPRQVHSYNQEKLYDVSRFYKPDTPRVNVVMHYAGRKAGEIISVGVDSGYRAKKLTVAPALFLGYARSLQVGADKYFTFATGSWLGGAVAHSACTDEIDRDYYCPNLTAWSDFQAPTYRLQHYYQLVFTHEF